MDLIFLIFDLWNVCFRTASISMVVEEGEECDCGWEGDCREPCCHPQRRHPPPGEVPCRLTPQSVCSPSQVYNYIDDEPNPLILNLLDLKYYKREPNPLNS